ncbi:hypothetical protein J2X16_001692 [Pelomonas aquatica]|uniref:Uncharacterized protein n=1 Tax=Pelomonas aquatica TaxID=431058 RepID=A0ABU1Z6V9_9BURK|nr:hypothetical protein [Pelomonas aquatica]MDR7296353.1 hypothetical protein [Pelomonas aquatica]
MTNRSQSWPTAETALDLDPATWPADWRREWEIKEQRGSVPRAWHRTGLCYFFEFEPIDEQGSWAWLVYDDDISQSRLIELQAELGEEAFQTLSLFLGRQAKVLWQEHGHGDFRLGG